MTGGNPYQKNSIWLLYMPSQTCRMILAPLLLVSSYAATAGTFAPTHLIYVYMPQILGFFRSIDMEWNETERILLEYYWVLLPRSLGNDFDTQFELLLLPFEIFDSIELFSLFLEISFSDVSNALLKFRLYGFYACCTYKPGCRKVENFAYKKCMIYISKKFFLPRLG